MSTRILNIGEIPIKTDISTVKIFKLFEILIYSLLQKLLIFYHNKGQGSRFWNHSNVAYHLKSFKKFL